MAALIFSYIRSQSVCNNIVHAVFSFRREKKSRRNNLVHWNLPIFPILITVCHIPLSLFYSFNRNQLFKSYKKLRFYYSLVPNFLCICLLALRPPFRYSKNYPFICELVSPQMQSAEVVLGPLDSPAFLHLIFCFPLLHSPQLQAARKAFVTTSNYCFCSPDPFIRQTQKH